MTVAALNPIALVGPTASGKSAVSLALAQRWPLEIISVDSALVYRGMDIGTAKPTPAERAQVPHHLIDIRNPDQPYSAAEFAADATGLIADIQARGKHPLLVGVVRGITIHFFPPAGEASMYVLMILVLLFRPRGLLGERIERFD